jgi:hypothetical protein
VSSTPIPSVRAVAPVRHRFVAAAALALLPAAGCTTWSHERYLARIGLLAGQQAVLENYQRALERRDFAAIGALFDDSSEGRSAAARATDDLRTKLSVAADPSSTIDMVEADVRDFDLFAERPTATLGFNVGARTSDGVRHVVRLRSQATFRLVAREPAQDDADGIPVGHLALIDQAPFEAVMRSSARPHFEDATQRAGLADRHRNQVIEGKCRILEGTMPGSGAAAADFDGDGLVDLAAIDGQHSVLYVNRGDGTFADRSREWGLDRFTGAGAVAADYDNDGDEDLWLCDHFGGARLLRNDGGHFTDVTAESGCVCTDPCFSASFADVDRDGDLDLFVPCSGDYYTTIPMPPFEARDGRPDQLFVNDGHGRFTEEGAARGVASTGWGLASAFCDYDEDGDDDLYVANDFGLNELYQNDGTGRFKDVAGKAGAADRGYGMGISWGDVDNDGHFDAYVSDIWTGFHSVFLDPDYPLPFLGRVMRFWVGPQMDHMGLGNALLRSNGDGTFTDVGKQWHVNEAGWAWAAMFLDFDDDGDLDIYSPDGSFTGTREGELEIRFWSLASLMWERSGMTDWMFSSEGRSLHGHERKRLFEQVAPGRFDEVGYLDGVNAIESGRGLAVADFDDDGSPDLYLRNLDARAIYYRNTGGANHWLKLRLVGTKSNRDAVGAVVRATAGGVSQLRQVTAGEGFYSSHDKRPLFGLGAATSATVVVKWPSGLVETFPELAADRAYVVTEGRGEAVPGR